MCLVEINVHNLISFDNIILSGILIVGGGLHFRSFNVNGLVKYNLL